LGSRGKEGLSIMSKKNNGVNPIKVVELPDLKPNQIGSVKPIEDGKEDLWEGELILEDRVL